MFYSDDDIYIFETISKNVINKCFKKCFYYRDRLRRFGEQENDGLK